MFRCAAFIIGIIISQLLILPSAAQDSDSVLNWYKSFFEEGNQPPAEEMMAKATTRVQEAQESHNGAKEAQAQKELGLLHLTRSHNYDQAMDHFIRALIIEDSLGLSDEQAFTFIAMARVFEEVGNNYRSAQFLEQALDLNEHSGNVHVTAFIDNELGKINAAMGRMEEASDNYELALTYKDQIGQPKVEAEALFNLAHLHTMQGNYREALRYHKRSLSIWRSINDKKNEARSLNDIGELYRLMKNDDRALANHLVALEIRQQLDDKSGLAESYNNIGSLYIRQKDFDRAIANINLALKAGLESQSQDQISKSYEYLSSCYRALGNFEKALSYKDLYLEILDFIQNEKNERQLLEIQNRYVIDKKESQIDQLESDRAQRDQEIQAQKKVRNILYVAIGLTLVIVILVLYLFLNKRRSNKILQAAHEKMQQQNLELQNLNATKDKFFSIISHDLKGPLNSLTSFSGLLINHTDSLSREEIQMLAKDLDQSIKNLFGLLENLLEWSRSQTGVIEFTPERFNLAGVLEENRSLLNVQAQNKRITIMSEVNEEILVNVHRNSVRTVIRNLLSNAIKFTPEGGAIKLAMSKHQNEVIISVADTGVGMSEETISKLFRIDAKLTTKGTANEKGTGLGLILCKDFIEKNGGRIWATSEIGKGSIFYFALPWSDDRRDQPSSP
jgi:signal transduction histidine kinase/Tfp pilus assembly protein PilF